MLRKHRAGAFEWQRVLYSILFYALSPLVPLYLLWRARRQPEYARGWGERFAWCYGGAIRSKAERRIWLHAVSLGETRAAQPLLDELFARDESVHVILTHTTPTGRAAGRELFAPYLDGGRMRQVYVPYDLPDVVARFLGRFAPTDCWLMETEIWPNMIGACVARGIPVSLLNGRMSEKTLQKTLKNTFFRKLFKVAYGQLSRVCAQSAADVQRYEQLGVAPERLALTGNVKFDMNVPYAQVAMGESLRRLVLDGSLSRRVILLASTRDGEEKMWLDALRHITIENVQWWIVPRHPQRFNEVERLLVEAGFLGERLLRKTQLDWLENDGQRRESLQKAHVVLGDTMGEMFAYYAMADIVLMGGAWQPLGGQNFLEPLSLGKPTIVGVSTYNFAQAAQDAVADDALIQVPDLDAALIESRRLLVNNEYRQHRQVSAKKFVAKHQGAVRRTLDGLHIKKKKNS